MTDPFSFDKLLATGTPAPAVPYKGLSRFHFVGGNNDPECVPAEALAESAQRVLRAQGSDLAVYYPNGGPLGDRGLREFLAGKLEQQRGFNPGIDKILVTPGSNTALDLICQALIDPGDTVLAEEHSYSNMISRMRSYGATVRAIRLDANGICCDHLESVLAELDGQGVTPKFLFTIPTVQNPTATVLPMERRKQLLELTRRFGVAVIEDECYSDLLWDETAPPAMAGMPGAEHVIHLSSFSKFLAPALRLGFITADTSILMRLQALKTDSGTCSLTQMIVADYLSAHYDAHVAALNEKLRNKRDVLVSALRDNFGDSVQFTVPPGGIFLWVRMPSGVNTSTLAPIALAQGLAFNPGAEWSVNGEQATRYMRICYAHPSVQDLRDGIRLMREICEAEYPGLSSATAQAA